MYKHSFQREMGPKKPRFDWDSEKFGVKEFNTVKLRQCIEREEGGKFIEKLKDKSFNKAKNNYYMKK